MSYVFIVDDSYAQRTSTNPLTHVYIRTIPYVVLYIYITTMTSVLQMCILYITTTW